MSTSNTLLELDRQFCEESRTTKEEAWMKYFDTDAIMATPGNRPYMNDRTQIHKALHHLYQLDNLYFHWEPEFGMLSTDQTLGFTTGVYERRYSKDNDIITETGKYITIWKLHKGTYKIVFDMGN